MIELFDDEVKKIYEVVEAIRVKHMDGSSVSGDKLSRLANELQGRLHDAGFESTVDVTPLLAGDAPVVRIDGRVEYKTPDFERKMWDIEKRVEKNETPPDIEGHV